MNICRMILLKISEMETQSARFLRIFKWFSSRVELSRGEFLPGGFLKLATSETKNTKHFRTSVLEQY